MSLKSFSASDLLVKPTYDGAFYGTDKIIPLGTDTLALQSITWSALDELLQNTPDGGGEVFIEDYPRLISDIDDLGIMNEGDGVRYDRIFEWLADTSSFIYKFSITIAAALDVTAFTSGAHSVDSVRFILTERLKDGTQVGGVLADKTIDTGMTDTAAVETKVAIVHFEKNTPFKIAQGNKLRIQIIFNSTDTLVATTFEGIMPWFFFQQGSLAKTLSASAIILHIQPALDSAFTVYRDQSLTQELDYAGITRDCISRLSQCSGVSPFKPPTPIDQPVTVIPPTLILPKVLTPEEVKRSCG